MSQYSFKEKTDYLTRNMFLDGKVTVQRFEEVKYQKLQNWEKMQRGFFWVPEEITLMQDKQDFKEASGAVKHIFTSNILRQTALDSIQGRAPAQIFTPVASVPELEALIMAWSFFEVLHSNSYSHLIRNIYSIPKDEFNKIHDIKPIVDMASSVGKYYDVLHHMNCLAETGFVEVSVREHKKAILMALHASYALEAIRFMVSFATSLGMVENKIFVGNGNIISLILQDELLHTEWSAWLINQVRKEDEEFASLDEEFAEEIQEMYLGVIEEEKSWADYLFKEGVVIGMNADIMKQFVDWTAHTRLKEIGVKYDTKMKSTPLPWFNKHVRIDKKQTALMENESTSYIIGVLSSDVYKDQLTGIV